MHAQGERVNVGERMENEDKRICKRLPCKEKGTRKMSIMDRIISFWNKRSYKNTRHVFRRTLPSPELRKTGNQPGNLHGDSTKKSYFLLLIISLLVCSLLLFYTGEKITFHFFLFRKDYWDMIHFATLLFYSVDALWISHAFVIYQDDPVSFLIILTGLSGITRSKFRWRKKHLINLTLVLIGTISYGVYTLFENIPFGDWSARNLILGRAMDLHFTYLTARSIQFNQHDLYRTSLTIPKLILGFIGICSKFISSIVQFVMAGVKMFPVTNALKQDKVGDYDKIYGRVDNKRLNDSNKIAKAVKECLQVVKVWTINYCLVIWGYNWLMSAYDDGKNSVWAHVCLFGLSLGLTHYLTKNPKGPPGWYDFESDRNKEARAMIP